MSDDFKRNSGDRRKSGPASRPSSGPRKQGERPSADARPKSADARPKSAGAKPKSHSGKPYGKSEYSKSDRNDGPKKPYGKSASKPTRVERSAAPPPPPAKRPDEGQRIAKVMARAGLCSRRDAELWIAEGRVAINDIILDTPATIVQPGDRISVDGQPMKTAERTRLFMFHKPRGLVTTDKDPEGRQTIFDYLYTRFPDAPRVVTIGRLDINTEGLLLLTNDGGLARVLELPTTGWLRRYRVRANGSVTQEALDQLAQGITIEGIHYVGIEARLDRIQGANVWLTMGLREGKNREIKRVLEHMGLGVNRLIRLSYGPFQLLDLPEGDVEEVKTRILREQLGPELAAQAGADFTMPLEADLPRPVADERAMPAYSLPDSRKDGRIGLRPTGKMSLPRGRKEAVVEEPEERPRLERPLPGPRKHVSALRAKREESLGKGPRKQVEQRETQDRKGRSVAVERIRSRPEKPGAEEPASRNGRRFQAGHQDVERDAKRAARDMKPKEMKPWRDEKEERAQRRDRFAGADRGATGAGAKNAGAKKSEAKKPFGQKSSSRPFSKPDGDRPQRGRPIGKPSGPSPRGRG